MEKFAQYTGQIPSKTRPWHCETIKSQDISLSHDIGTSDFPKIELDKLANNIRQIPGKTRPWHCETIKSQDILLSHDIETSDFPLHFETIITMDLAIFLAQTKINFFY